MTSRKANQAQFVGVAAWLFRKRWVAGLLGLVAFCPPAWAQFSPPGAGAGAGGAATSALGAGAGAGTPAAAPTTIWSRLGLSSSNLQACRDKICKCQIGQMFNSLLSGPVGAISGGFVCPLCPPAPTAAQIAALEQKPNGGAEAAAAKIQASEADAKARVAAVEYLGTVDCNRFPEAKKGLLGALREDPNECVRFAAARSLNSGCCCDQEVIEKLRISVAGEKKGGPAETSCRVKAAAFSALQNCLMRVPEEVEEAPQPLRAPPEGPRRAPPEEPRRAPPERSEGLPEPIPDPTKRVKPIGTTMNTADTSTITTSLKVANPRARTIEEESKTKPFAQTIKEARQTLFEAARYPQASATLPPGKRSVYHALLKARKDIEGKSRPNPKDPSPGRDPGVAPSTSGPAPASAPGQANSIPGQVPGSEPSASGEIPQQTETENPQSSSPAKRGLFGLLLKQ